MFNPHKHPKRFRGQRQKALNQGFSGLGAHVSLVHSVLLFNIFVVQSLRLLVCQLHVDNFFGLACGNKNYKLFTEGWNVEPNVPIPGE